MRVNIKRHIIGCVIPVIIATLVFLTGCGNAAGTDGASVPDTAEEAGPEENDSILTEDNSIIIEDGGIPVEEIEEQETADTGGSESAGLYDTDSHLDTMEIYERFLSGELTVTRKKEQVSIAELFWDNDIEYCFYDIDGDGVEELHIRDSVAYYAVKACGSLPQILFEGWWGHEPLAWDGQCGILYYHQGYGSEWIAFMKVDADGGTKREGAFYWSDENRNGDMDEEDYFTAGREEEIPMEQYVRCRDEQLKKRDGNELEWKDRQLEAFVTWQESYAAYIKRRENINWMQDYDRYSLIYVDDDEIPELYIDTGGMATGEFVVSFYDGHMGVMNRERVGLHYMEHGGLLYSESGNMGFYPCNIYRLLEGEFSEIGTGWCSESCDGETVNFDYFWEGCPVTETEYEAQIAERIDKAACVEPAELYTKEEILGMLEDEPGWKKE